jgi:hypothetical protein
MYRKREGNLLFTSFDGSATEPVARLPFGNTIFIDFVMALFSFVLKAYSAQLVGGFFFGSRLGRGGSFGGLGVALVHVLVKIVIQPSLSGLRVLKHVCIELLVKLVSSSCSGAATLEKEILIRAQSIEIFRTKIVKLKR